MDHLQGYGPVMVAYSGGVDSAMLAAAAWRAYCELHKPKTPTVAEAAAEAVAKAHDLAEERKEDWPSPLPMLAVVANAESLAANELKDAIDLAERLGFPYRVVDHSELGIPEYLANAPDRCYHCRSAMASRLRQVAEAEGFEVIVDGLNADDVGDYRPGVAAFNEANIRHPLMELGITKAQVRELARELGLGHIAKKPANACLASRVPHGTPITGDILKMIEDGEAALGRLGFIGHRVRYHAQPTGSSWDGGTGKDGNTGNEEEEAISAALARIEVRDPDDIARLVRPETREAVHWALKEAGFRWVALDLQGYKMGSMNLVD